MMNHASANTSPGERVGATVVDPVCGMTVNPEAAAGFVRVTVHNDGPAIPPDELARLFQRFFRSRTVRGEAGGLGLGLTICRAIVQAQGGEIGVDSAAERGTSVHFTLPKARELAQEAGSA